MAARAIQCHPLPNRENPAKCGVSFCPYFTIFLRSLHHFTVCNRDLPNCSVPVMFQKHNAIRSTSAPFHKHNAIHPPTPTKPHHAKPMPPPKCDILARLKNKKATHFPFRTDQPQPIEKQQKNIKSPHTASSTIAGMVIPAHPRPACSAILGPLSLYSPASVKYLCTKRNPTMPTVI